MSDDEGWDGGSPWLFLLGLLVFLGSAALFLIDFVRGADILRSLVVNTVGAALLITWAAHDTLNDPASEVATVGGAAGTALLLYGLYLFGAGIVVTVTGLFHDRLALGLMYVAVAFLAVTAGFVIFPREAVLTDDEEQEGKEETDREGQEGETGADREGKEGEQGTNSPNSKGTTDEQEASGDGPD